MNKQTTNKAASRGWLLAALLILELTCCDLPAPANPSPAPPSLALPVTRVAATVPSSTPTAHPSATFTSTPIPALTSPPATPVLIWLPTMTPLPPNPTAAPTPPLTSTAMLTTPINSPLLVLDLPASYTVTLNQNLEFTPPGYVDGPLLAALWLPGGHHYDAGIVMVHGGGLTSGDRLLDRRWGDELAARGFVVLAIDYPLMPGHPFPQAVRAVKTGIEYLRRHAAALGISENKIALQGYSSGASLVSEAFFTPDQDSYFGTSPTVSDRAELLFAYYGAYDLGAGFSPDGAYYVDEEGPKRGNALQLAENAPGPVYLWHARGDPTVNWTDSLDLANALRLAGKEVYLYIAPSDKHVFDRNGPGVPAGSLNSLGQVCLGQELAALVGKLGATR